MKRREIQRKLRRDRRVLRRREVHRHAGEALLERDVRPPCVRGRGASRARDPARRRGARGRRRRVPARCLGRMEDFGSSGRTVLFVSHNMQAIAQLCDRAICSTAAASSATGRADGDRRALPADRRMAPARAAPGPTTRRRPATTSSGSARSASSTRTRRRSTRRRPPTRRDRARLPRTRGRRPTRLSEDQGHDRRGRRRLQRDGHRPTLARAVAAGGLRLDRVDPGNLLNEGLVTVDVAVVSLDSPKLAPHAGGTRPSRSTSTTRARATRPAGRSPASGEASSVRARMDRQVRANLAGSSSSFGAPEYV